MFVDIDFDKDNIICSVSERQFDEIRFDHATRWTPNSAKEYHNLKDILFIRKVSSLTFEYLEGLFEIFLRKVSGSGSSTISPATLIGKGFAKFWREGRRDHKTPKRTSVLTKRKVARA